MAIDANLSWRRIGFLALVVVAAAMLTVVAMVMLGEDPLLAEEDAFRDPFVLPPGKRPNILFPELVRTTDLSLNRFVDRFARVCMEGKYSDLRLLLSTRSGDPLVARRFESMFNALKQVRILALEEVPRVPGLEGSAYLLLAEYVLEDYAATKGRSIEQVRLAIAREEGVWRIGPIPRNLLAALEARSGSSSSQPTSQGSDSATLGSASPAASGAAANRPVSITPN